MCFVDDCERNTVSELAEQVGEFADHRDHHSPGEEIGGPFRQIRGFLVMARWSSRCA